MYLYYEHHRDAAGKVLLTEMRLSSHSNGILAIKHKNPTEDMLKALCLPIIKWPPVACRSMDEKSWIWSYFGAYDTSSSYGEAVIEKLLAVTKSVNNPIGLIEVSDLASQAVNHKVDLSGKKKLSAEEFFYNTAAPVGGQVLTKEQLAQKLLPLLSISNVTEIDKRSYRAAALRLHPDRNNGDNSKMSELNMLWQLWNAQAEVSVPQDK